METSSETSSVIVEFPELAIWLICDQLSYEDLQNLRATCKQLKEIIDQRPYQSLHLFLGSYPCERELFYTGEMIFYAHTLHISNPRILKSIKFQKQFSDLRKLTIHTSWSSKEWVDLNDLNCFQELVHLEVDCYKIEILDCKLSWRNLKILLLGIAEGDDVTTFVLDCPRLEVLDLYAGNQPRLTPATISSLKQLFIEYASGSETYLMILYGNLKKLTTISFTTDSDLNDFVLDLMEGKVYLPSLKKIDWEVEGRFSNITLLVRNLVNLKNRPHTKHYEVQINRKAISLDQLIELRNVLDKLVPPEDPEDLDHCLDWRVLYTELLQTFTENPILHWFLATVDTLVLNSSEDVTLSKKLIGKLRNLNYLQLEKGITLDDQFFGCILQTCRKVWHVRIYCAVSNDQLNRMPNYFQALENLSFADDFAPDDLNDLDFLAKFKNLKDLYVNFDLDREKLSFLLKNCNHRENFSLEFSPILGVFMGMKRKKNGRFRVVQRNFKRESKKEAEFDRVEDAVEYYQEKLLPSFAGLKPWARCCLM